MSEPVPGDLHVDGLLTDISIATMNQAGDYVADRAFPIVYVNKQSDKYVVYDDGWFQADEGDALRRAPGTNAKEVGYATTLTNSYFCDPYAAAKIIADEDRANADAAFNLDQEATQLVTEIIMIRREMAFAADFMATSKWQTDKVGTTNFVKWNDYGASDPFTDIEDGHRTIYGDISRAPTKLIMGDIVWRRLRHHPDFLDRIKYSAGQGNPALISLQLLAQLIEVEEVLVGRATRRSSNEGAATLTKARILDDDALLLYTPRTPGLYTPSGGYTFVWGKIMNGQRTPHFIRRIREERPMRDIVECHTYFDQKATATRAGYFWSDCCD